MAAPSCWRWYLKTFLPRPAITQRLQRIAQSVGVMHELGHSLGLMPDTCTEGIDNRSHLQPGFTRERRESAEHWENYMSCMNYDKFSKYFLGYSDGSNGVRDHDDWGAIDLTYFQKASDSMEGIEG
jgi:hypothetical protein